MSKKLFEQWKKRNDFIAIRSASSPLQSFFRGLAKQESRVPENSIAIIKKIEDIYILFPNDLLPDESEIIFIKTNEFTITLNFTNLLTKDNITIDNIKMRLAFSVPTEDFSVKNFLRHFYKIELATTTHNVREKIEQNIKADLIKFIAANDAEKLQSVDFRTELSNFFIDLLKRRLFDCGISFHNVFIEEISSQEYKKIMQDKIEQEKEIIRVKEFERRREEFKKQCEEIVQWLKCGSIKEVLDNIEDNHTRQKVYEWIVRNAFTPDLFNRVDDESKPVIDVLMDVMKQKGRFIQTIASLQKKFSAIAVACGRKIFYFDKSEDDFVLKWSVELSEPVRSVRYSKIEDKGVILAGGKKKLFLIETPELIKEYTIDYFKEVKGGFNSSTVSRNRLFATHSEIGLCVWNIDEPSGLTMFKEISSKYETTRAVQTDSNNNVFFTSGNNLFFLKADEDFSNCHKVEFETNGNITSLSMLDKDIFVSACKENYGEITRLHFSDFTLKNVSKVLKRRCEIYSVKPVNISYIPHLIYTTGESKVYARMLDENFEVQYEAQDFTIHHADGCEDFLFGLDLRNYSILKWKTTDPTRLSIFKKDTLGLDKVRDFDIISL